jgi:manganese/iron transport system permease protein
MAVAAAIGVASGVVGLAISQHWRVAAGATIVLVAATLFTVSLLVAPRHGLLARRRVSRPGAPAGVGVPTAGR